MAFERVFRSLSVFFVIFAVAGSISLIKFDSIGSSVGSQSNALFGGNIESCQLVCNGLCYNGTNLYCVNGKFYDTSGFDVSGEKKFCNNNLDCSTLFPFCSNHLCEKNNPINFIEVEINTPQSVEAGKDFVVDVLLQNKGNSSVDFSINNPQLFPFMWHPIEKNRFEYFLSMSGITGETDSRNKIEKIFLTPNSKKQVKYYFKASGKITFNAIVVLKLSMKNNSYKLLSSQPLIFFDNSAKTSVCGSIKFNSQYAECKNNVLFVYGDKWCKSAPGSCVFGGSEGNCVQNFCNTHYREFYAGDYSGIIVPVYLSKNAKEIEQQKKIIQPVADSIKINLNKWFELESKKTPINIKFDSQACTIPYSTFLGIQDESVSPEIIDFYENIALNCAIDRVKYSFVSFYFVPGSSQNLDGLRIHFPPSNNALYVANGISVLGKISDKSYPVYFLIIHEILHSFGAEDLYSLAYAYDGSINNAGSEFVWRACYFMRSRFEVFKRNNYIPLCKLESSFIQQKS